MDDHSQGDICRVCRCEATADRQLFHPCICSGSIKWIHEDCLQQWMRYSRKEYCELCGHRFSFTPIYAPDMPRVLPLRDVAGGLLSSVGTAVKYWLHYTLVALAWLGIVPLTGYRTYRFLFSGVTRNGMMIMSFPYDMFSTESITADVFRGCFVVTCTLFAFIGLIWLREQILHGGGPDWLEQEDVPAGAADGDEAVVPPRPPRRAAAGAAAAAAAAPVVEGEAAAAAAAGHPDMDGVARPNAAEAPVVEGEAGAAAAAQPAMPGDELGAVPVIGAQAAAAEVPGRPHHVRAAAENNNNINNPNNNEAPDDGDDPFRGPPEPEQHPRIDPAEPPPAEAAAEADDEDLLLDGDDEGPVDADGNPVEGGDNDGGADVGGGGGGDEVNWNPMEWDRAAEELTWERLLGLDGSMVFLEHVFWVVSLNTIFILVFAYCPYTIGHLFVTAMGLLRHNKTLLHFHGLVTTIIGYCLVGFVFVQLHAIARWMGLYRVRRVLGLCYIVVKVSLLSVVEIGVLPLVCGWWLDICSLPVFDATLKDRRLSFRAAPGTSLFIHWMFGMVYVYYFASFVVLLREVLRPGVLWFLRNLNDPDFSPIQEMIHLPIMKHVRRLVVSAVIFGSIVMLMLWLPIQILKHVWPSFLPYTLSGDSEVNELSLQLLLLQIILPGFFEQSHTRIWLKGLIRVWCNAVAWLLGIRSYLLGNDEQQPDNAAAADAANDANNDANNGAEAANAAAAAAGAAAANADLDAARNRDAPVIDAGLGLGAAHQALFHRDVPMGFQPFVRPTWLPVRLFGLLVLMCISLCIGSLLTLTIPVWIGRHSMSLWNIGSHLHFLSMTMMTSPTSGDMVEALANATATLTSNVSTVLAAAATAAAATAAAAAGSTASADADGGAVTEATATATATVTQTTAAHSRPHELYTAALGIYLCWVLSRGVSIAVNLFPQGRAAVIEKLRHWLQVATSYAMAVTIFVLMLGVVPLLFGLLLELVVVIPLRVPIEQTPIFFLWQDWALGVLYTKIACALTLMGPDWALKRAIDRAYRDGIRDIDLRFIVRELAAPVIACFGLALAVPYVLAHSLVPLVYADPMVRIFVARRIYPFFLAVSAAVGVLVLQVRQFRKLYVTIKNDKYLVGQRLVNYDHRKRKQESAAAAAAAAANS